MKKDNVFGGIGCLLFLALLALPLLPLAIWNDDKGFIITMILYAILFTVLIVHGKKINNKSQEKVLALQSICQYDAENACLKLQKRDDLLTTIVKIQESMNYTTKNTPVKVHYGSATVGNVTTGGIYTTGGQTVFNGSNSSGRWEMLYTGQVESQPTDKSKHLIKTIQLSDKLYDEAKTSSIREYLNENRQIIVVEKVSVFSKDTNTALLEAQHMMANLTSQETQNKMKLGYPSRQKCESIYNWIIGRM